MTAPSLSACRRASRAAVPLLAALAVAGCIQHKVDVTGSVPTDVRDRHPIELTDAPHSIEVFTSASARGLGERQTSEVRAFAAEWRSRGRSAIIAEVPSHGAGHGMSDVHRVLAAGGVPGGAVQVRAYAAHDPYVAAPIRLSFAKLTARVPHACGQWSEDLGASNPRFSATNQPQWNFGCAYQTNLAAQIDDPLDLVRPRGEGRIDTLRRMNAIGKLREGQDPSTEYRSEATRINQTVGSN